MNAIITKLLETLEGGLVVSCQAYEGDPMFGAEIMAAYADAARMAGAVGIRANGPQDIAAIKKRVDLPVIGIWKIYSENSPVYITPTLDAAREIWEAGSDIICLDATQRKAEDGSTAEERIRRIKEELGAPVMADISTKEEGIEASDAGADIIATTLATYTEYSRQGDDPDIELIRELAESIDKPIIAEGHYRTVDQVRSAFAAGAHAVVIGTAITRPEVITKQFVEVTPRYKGA